MCTRCTRINAVKGVDIRVQSYSNECDETNIPLSSIRMILICRNFNQYVRYTWCILGEMSNIQATMCHMSYSSEIPSNCNAHNCVYRLYTPKRKTKGEINNHTVMNINAIHMFEWHTCILKTACTSYVALVYVCTHERLLRTTSVHAKIK